MKASPLSYENQLELFDVVLAKWSPDWMNLPKYLEDFGLTENILKVPYAMRDDGMKYWKLIEKYVEEVVDYHFEDSEAIFFGNEIIETGIDKFT